MPRYIFLDNWVFSLVRNPKLATGLIAFIRSNGLTVIITSLSMTELYNPGWKEGGASERGAAAAKFLARIPCVIVSPVRVWEMEIAANLCPLSALPVELDLAELSEDLRAAALLGFLRRDSLYLQQGKDIQAWSLEYEETKKRWPSSVANIIENACHNDDLRRDKKGRFTDLSSTREVFLLSLDLRLAERAAIDSIIADLVRRKKEGQVNRLTSIRLSSLCFWYSYVEIDKNATPKHGNSDIGDFHQISLLPYCSAFTTDGAMYNMLQRIHEQVVPAKCEVMTKRLLEERIRQYT